MSATEDVYRWYHIADAFVIRSDVESLPRSGLEAMAFDLPVLATSVFVLSELIVDGENGLLCEPLDLDALVAGFACLIALTPAERQAMGRRDGAGLRRQRPPGRSPANSGPSSTASATSRPLCPARCSPVPTATSIPRVGPAVLDTPCL